MTQPETSNIAAGWRVDPLGTLCWMWAAWCGPISHSGVVDTESEAESRARVALGELKAPQR